MTIFQLWNNPEHHRFITSTNSVGVLWSFILRLNHQMQGHNVFQDKSNEPNNDSFSYVVVVVCSTFSFHRQILPIYSYLQVGYTHNYKSASNWKFCIFEKALLYYLLQTIQVNDEGQLGSEFEYSTALQRPTSVQGNPLFIYDTPWRERIEWIRICIKFAKHIMSRAYSLVDSSSLSPKIFDIPMG